MKIRNDFVSNSSSSSFVMFGVQVTESELTAAYVRIVGKQPDEDVTMSDMFYEVFDSFDTGLDTKVFDYDSDEVWVGSSPSSMSDDETLAQFKAKVVEKVNKILVDTPKAVKDVQYVSGVDQDGCISFD